jgi:hypothetical protein
MRRIVASTIVIFILCGLLMFSGCGGGGAKTEVKQAPQTTLGQELLDLDKAHKQGVISDEEFKKLKKEIVEKYED